MSKHGFFFELIRNRVLYLMCVPVIVYFILFHYLPIGGIVMAFKDFNYRQGIYGSPWNGFTNFAFFFKSGKAWQVTKNTFLYNLLFLALYTFFSVLVAILISELKGKYFKKITQSSMFLPYFISWVVVSAMLYNFCNYEYGMVNRLLRALGQQPINIYANPRYWYAILPIMYVWKWVGFGSVIYLAAIMGIDQECYEAATIDGATEFQKIFRITLPLLRPTMVILVLLSVGRILRGEFDMFYQLIGNNGMLLDSTDIIDTLVFRSLVGTQDFPMAAAAGLYQSVLCFVIILIVNRVVKTLESDYALF
ncbi:MAG TPA: ABC transporter permease subunit [Spirochaetia bacterium]|nr:ABC transporter permease subunit [Spirochaetia bacterium]